MANAQPKNTFKLSQLKEMQAKDLDKKDLFLVSDYDSKDSVSSKALKYGTLMKAVATNPELLSSIAEDPGLLSSVAANPELVDNLISNPELVDAVAASPSLISTLIADPDLSAQIQQKVDEAVSSAIDIDIIDGGNAKG